MTLLQKLTPEDLFPGVKDFLDQAQALGIPCAIASASKNAPFILEKLGVIDEFDAIVDPATLTKGKPDPEIFVKACELIHVAPGDAIGFEDAQAGIQGIKGAGMYAVGVSTGEALDGADKIITHFTEITAKELSEL